MWLFQSLSHDSRIQTIPRRYTKRIPPRFIAVPQWPALVWQSLVIVGYLLKLKDALDSSYAVVSAAEIEQKLALAAGPPLVHGLNARSQRWCGQLLLTARLSEFYDREITIGCMFLGCSQ